MINLIGGFEIEILNEGTGDFNILVSHVSDPEIASKIRIRKNVREIIIVSGKKGTLL